MSRLACRVGRVGLVRVASFFSVVSRYFFRVASFFRGCVALIFRVVSLAKIQPKHGNAKMRRHGHGHTSEKTRRREGPGFGFLWCIGNKRRETEFANPCLGKPCGRIFQKPALSRARVRVQNPCSRARVRVVVLKNPCAILFGTNLFPNHDGNRIFNAAMRSRSMRPGRYGKSQLHTTILTGKYENTDQPTRQCGSADA